MIQRLVGGSLSGNEYREILIRLNQSTDGWKRCSLAFLEVQALQQELKEIDFTKIDFAVDNRGDGCDQDLVGDLDRMATDPSLTYSELLDSILSYEQYLHEQAGHGGLVGEDGSNDREMRAKYPDQFLLDAPRSVGDVETHTGRKWRGGHRQKRNKRNIGIKVFVGFASCLLAFVVTMQRFSDLGTDAASKGSTSLNHGSGFNLENSRFVSRSVPIVAEQEATIADTYTDISFIEHLVDPMDYEIVGTSSELDVKHDDGYRYETPIRRIDIRPKDHDRYR